ncbi:hypothetical protein PY650_14390 [Rhizobium calliandrae]|uniref:MarR family transcriptional regulator n=1 Tax=Rhizobium calliandrae TaxID=1312182 RepID=A0ABT7KDZ5_9HYPH|nr:hypothetical protein [Rhizobium calliandrae]MDL2406827.1 hypothetical protein [Rhizobium calliandrae]
MSVIDHHPDLAVAEFGQIMVMERTTLLRTLKPLLVEDLIFKTKRKGQRSHTFNLTAAGTARLKQAAPLWRAAQEAFTIEVGLTRSAELLARNLEVVKISST